MLLCLTFICTDLIGENLHEYAQGGAPRHGRAQALEESQEVGEADEGADIFEVRKEAKEESGDPLKDGADVEAHLGAQPISILPEQGTE